MGELKKGYSDVLDFSKVSKIIKENLVKVKYPKNYLDEIKLRLKVSQVVTKLLNLKEE